MRIDGTKTTKVEELKKDVAQKTATPAGPRAVVGDAVVVSARTQQLTAHSHETSEARAQRVADIGKALEAGTYQIDYQKLSERLVDEELARWGR